MSLSTKKVVVAVALTVLLVTSGCALRTYGGEQKYLIVEEVDSAPDQAEVVPLDNETVQQSPTLVDAVSKVVDSRSSETGVPLSDSEYREVRRVTGSLPVYEGPDETGIYVRAGDTMVTFEFIEQS